MMISPEELETLEILADFRLIKSLIHAEAEHLGFSSKVPKIELENLKVV